MPATLDAPELSVIVPTLNEAANLSALAARIASALHGRPYEILFIDDGSTDGTRAAAVGLGTHFPVRLYVRDNPSDGLSGAVVHGLSQARGRYLVVMDADLQHPPERVLDLIAPLEQGRAEFVLGSRYVPGGRTESAWGRLRGLNSRLATTLARPFASGIRDPMSGFFALRRETFEGARDLNPIGYKIALELICKCRVRRVTEVPIDFGLRSAGQSKLTLTQQLRYLDHLSRLYDFCFPAASPHLKFVMATACAWLVAFGLYIRLVAHEVGPVFAPTLAFAAAVAATAIFRLHSLRAGNRPAFGRRPWTDFVMLALGEWAVCTLTARWVAYHVLRASALEVFLLAFGTAGGAGYLLRRRLTRAARGSHSVSLGTRDLSPTAIRNAA